MHERDPLLRDRSTDVNSSETGAVNRKGWIETSRRPDFRCTGRDGCTMIQAWVYAWVHELIR